LPQNHAPKRPEKVEADIHYSYIDKSKWILIVGKYFDGKPYELFGGIIPDDLNINKTIKTGYLVRRSKGHYDLLDDKDNILIKNITNTLNVSAYNDQTRMSSGALRHGMPVQYLVETLTKSGDKELGLYSFNKVVARVLKKYIPDGIKATGSKCPECGSTNLFYQEGCKQCPCGFSKCG